jgi:hypothetical protein
MESVYGVDPLVTLRSIERDNVHLGLTITEPAKAGSLWEVRWWNPSPTLRTFKTADETLGACLTLFGDPHEPEDQP